MKCMERKLTCRGGKVKGICGCCDKCAKVLNENCGGVYYYLGKCDKDLVCKPLIKTRRRKLWPGKGRCVRKVKRERKQSDEPGNDSQQCRPKCSPEFCRKRPRAICSATGGVALFERTCSSQCQLTSCRACYYEEEASCSKCSPEDYKCLRRFALCIKKKTCTRKRYPCQIRRTPIGPRKLFRCHVPDCP
ncbi:DgyrCDS6953 [Dimorphilus gyrociliatus]|uniref:DgyrCDS6953 n=1 Tax=Dimorphilus gyrociliatus TaxID=2664684 RepID=A0A7I8VPK9_9ANNE|nr:DgyrCDS6953 [Dimorphilus gyrociliatus]